MKKVAMVLLVVLAVAVSLSWAQDVSYYKAGDKGYFMYQQTDRQFFVNPNKDFTGSCGFFGEITPETKIQVINRTIDRGNLDLLTGKLVLAYGTFKEVGRGEGGKIICLELNLFILSTESYRIPIPPQK